MSTLTLPEELSLVKAKCDNLKAELQSKHGVFAEAKRLCLKAREERDKIDADLKKERQKSKTLCEKLEALTRELEDTKQLLEVFLDNSNRPKRAKKSPNFYRC